MDHTIHKQILGDLLVKAEPGRLTRSKDRLIAKVEWTGTQWKGQCVGQKDRIHHAIITVVGQRAFRCSCQDHFKQRGHKGPCKHVISLAKVGFAHICLLDVVVAAQTKNAVNPRSHMGPGRVKGT